MPFFLDTIVLSFQILDKLCEVIAISYLGNSCIILELYPRGCKCLFRGTIEAHASSFYILAGGAIFRYTWVNSNIPLSTVNGGSSVASTVKKAVVLKRRIALLQLSKPNAHELRTTNKSLKMRCSV